ncbi:MAG TPA: tripartite tricarboxylate transporter substrate binding protein [Xanthobacteraceae bacterium]
MPRMISTITALALAALGTAAAAQDWPTRPITMIVPFAPGGGSDVVARMIAPRLGEVLGQQVVIENIGGSGGMIGTYKVARAAPDGYELGFAVTGTLAQNQSLYKKPLYDGATDFAPIGLIADASYILITRPDFPAANLQEFIAYAKANRTKMQFGSAGAGSGTHITCLLLNSAIGVEVTHVPYRSTAQGMPDLLAGRIDYICEPVQTALPLIEHKSVKALATLTRERSPVLPNLPTAHEQGVTDFDAPLWFALFLPKDTPEVIVRRFNSALGQTLDTPDVRRRLESTGLRIAPPERRSPEYLARFVASEITKWAAPIKASGVSMD